MSNEQIEKGDDPHYLYKRELFIERLFSFLRQKLGYRSDMQYLAPDEFKTIPSPTRQEFIIYTKIIMWSDIHLLKRIKRVGIVLKHFMAHRGG